VAVCNIYVLDSLVMLAQLGSILLPEMKLGRMIVGARVALVASSILALLSLIGAVLGEQNRRGRECHGTYGNKQETLGVFHISSPLSRIQKSSPVDARWLEKQFRYQAALCPQIQKAGGHSEERARRPVPQIWSGT
jgi:hypothetical protein